MLDCGVLQSCDLYNITLTYVQLCIILYAQQTYRSPWTLSLKPGLFVVAHLLTKLRKSLCGNEVSTDNSVVT